MKVWKNTKTLDGLIDDLDITNNKSNAGVLLLGGKSISLNEFPNVKGIFRAGVGDNNVPYDEAKRRNVAVSLPSDDAKDYIYEETSNFTCHLILKSMYRSSNIGTISPWKKKSRVFLGDRTLLVIGKGRIGQKVYEKMHPFMRVDSYDILENSLKELHAKIESADCITLHIPLNDDTKDFIDKEKLSWMKEGCCLINTSRGDIVNELDITKSIRSGKITATFDVFWDEPYLGPLTKYPESFIMTPHVASTCDKFLIQTAKDFRDFMKKVLK